MSKPTSTPKPKVKKRGRAPRKGALVVISTLLIGSAVLRVAVDANAAIAKQTDAAQHIDAAPISEPQVCKTEKDIEPMLEAFQQREARLDAREAAIDERMKALELADEAVKKRLAALQEAETQLRDTIALADSAAEDDLGKLTAVYENMKPKQAAALFETMDPQFAAGFLGRMAPESAAAIMAGLTPNAAYTISAVLAGRNANVPTD